MLIRCSQLAALMTKPRNKSEVLSETAKTMIRDIVREQYFGSRKELTGKALEKGLRCENDSIELLNTVLFNSYEKHSGRLSNEYITGECDLLAFADNHGRDIKTSWSLATFPLFAEDVKEDYEWQARGYMWLYERDKWFIDFCLVDTPDDLIGYEQPELHYVSHIPPERRVFSLMFERDESKEREIITNYGYAKSYYDGLLDQLASRS